MMGLRRTSNISAWKFLRLPYTPLPVFGQRSCNRTWRAVLYDNFTKLYDHGLRISVPRKTGIPIAARPPSPGTRTPAFPRASCRTGKKPTLRKVDFHYHEHSDGPGIEGAAMPAVCEHISQIRDVTPSAKGCEDCLKMGDTWVHLRICLQCGHVGCCDQSKNKHATKHFQKTVHPIIQSFQPGESWKWCYVDRLFIE